MPSDILAQGSSSSPNKIVETTLTEDGVALPLPEIQDLVLQRKRVPILEDKIENLEKDVANLEEQSKLKDAQLEVAEERRKLLEDRVKLMEEVNAAQKKVIEDYGKVTEALQAKIKSLQFWNKVGPVASFLIGIGLTIAVIF